MRWLRLFALLAIVLALAPLAEAKLVFRDGQWVRVPDDEDVTAEPAQADTQPAETKPVAETQPAPEPEPTPAQKPIETPAETPAVVPVEPAPSPSVEPTPPPVELPPLTPPQTPTVPAETPTPAETPRDDQALMPMQPIEPETPAATAADQTPTVPAEPAVAPETQPSPVAETPAMPEAAPAPETPVMPETPATAETPAPMPAAEPSAEAPATEPPATAAEAVPPAPAPDEEVDFVFRDGRWEPVVRSQTAPKPSTVPQITELPDAVITPMPGEPATADLVTEPPLVTPITNVRPEDHGPALPPPVEVQPLPEPALAIDQVPSVGEKYRQIEPSAAADEAESLLAAAGQADGDGPAAVRSMIAKFRDGRYAATAKLASKFLKRHAVSPSGEPASWLRAEAVFSGGDYYRAFDAYEHFITNYAGSRLVDKALLREVQCAEALFGPARRKVLGLGLGSGNDEAVGILEKVYAHRPTGPLAADALFRIGEFKMSSGKSEEAEEQFRRFIDEFPNHSRARQARLMAAQSAIASCLGPVYDDAPMRRAGGMLQSYQDTYPEMAAQENVAGALEAIRRHEATKKYEMAVYYQRAGRLKAAAFYARKVVDEFPGTPASVEAREMLQELPPPPAVGR
ncbi:MAG: outer membrane protein assembly factor BamD [Phycisphaerae bacterium]|nr:outer membrane protein assembly factor BamD [Phycisphaerae bacterium]